MTNFWQALSFRTYQKFSSGGFSSCFSFYAFGFCIFHGFSILIEIYAHIQMRQRWRRRGEGGANAEVDPLSERVGHVFAKKCCKLLKISKFTCRRGRGRKRRGGVARHDLQTAFPLFMCFPTNTNKKQKCMQNILLARCCFIFYCNSVSSCVKFGNCCK